MSVARIAAASSQALSTLSSASKEIILYLEEGFPIEVDVSNIIPASSAPSRGVGVAASLKLQTHSQSLAKSEQQFGGISLVRAATSRTGNTSLFSIARKSILSDNFNDSHESYTSGANSITISSSRVPEKLFMSFDPVTLSETTTTFLYESCRFVFFKSSTVASFASLPASQIDAGIIPLISSTEYIILLQCVDGSLVMLAKTGTSFDSSTASTTASNIAPAASAFRFSREFLKPGLGFTSSPGSPTFNYSASRLPLKVSTTKTGCTIATAAPTTPASYGEWTAYLISTDPSGVDAVYVDQTCRVFFEKTFLTLAITPAGTGERSKFPCVVAATDPVNPGRISMIFNASLIYATGDFVSPDGGISMG